MYDFLISKKRAAAFAADIFDVLVRDIKAGKEGARDEKPERAKDEQKPNSQKQN